MYSQTHVLAPLTLSPSAHIDQISRWPSDYWVSVACGACGRLRINETAQPVGWSSCAFAGRQSGARVWAQNSSLRAGSRQRTRPQSARRDRGCAPACPDYFLPDDPDRNRVRLKRDLDQECFPCDKVVDSGAQRRTQWSTGSRACQVLQLEPRWQKPAVAAGTVARSLGPFSLPRRSCCSVPFRRSLPHSQPLTEIRQHSPQKDKTPLLHPAVTPRRQHDLSDEGREGSGGVLGGKRWHICFRGSMRV